MINESNEESVVKVSEQKAQFDMLLNARMDLEE